MVVSLAVRVVDLEEGWVRGGTEPYAKVVLVDADRATIGPIHLWDFLPSDLQIDGLYMFRGLRVSLRRVFNETTQQWHRVPHNSGDKVLERGVFTAVEPVEHESVTQYFVIESGLTSQTLQTRKYLLLSNVRCFSDVTGT